MCSRQKFNTPKFIWQASRVHKVKYSAGNYTGKFNVYYTELHRKEAKDR
jgi:hypothetical protein